MVTRDRAENRDGPKVRGGRGGSRGPGLRRGQGPGDSGGGRGRAEAEVIPGFEACLADCGKFLKRWEYQTTLSAS